MPTSSPTAAKWCSKTKAAAILDVCVPFVDKLIRERRLTARQIPGARPKVYLPDVERLARESTIAAEPDPAGR